MADLLDSKKFLTEYTVGHGTLVTEIKSGKVFYISSEHKTEISKDLLRKIEAQGHKAKINDKEVFVDADDRVWTHVASLNEKTSRLFLKTLRTVEQQDTSRLQASKDLRNTLKDANLENTDTLQSVEASLNRGADEMEIIQHLMDLANNEKSPERIEKFNVTAKILLPLLTARNGSKGVLEDVEIKKLYQDLIKNPNISDFCLVLQHEKFSVNTALLGLICPYFKQAIAWASSPNYDMRQAEKDIPGLNDALKYMLGLPHDIEVSDHSSRYYTRFACDFLGILPPDFPSLGDIYVKSEQEKLKVEIDVYQILERIIQESGGSNTLEFTNEFDKLDTIIQSQSDLKFKQALFMTIQHNWIPELMESDNTDHLENGLDLVATIEKRYEITILNDEVLNQLIKPETLSSFLKKAEDHPDTDFTRAFWKILPQKIDKTFTERTYAGYVASFIYYFDPWQAAVAAEGSNVRVLDLSGISDKSLLTFQFFVKNCLYIDRLKMPDHLPFTDNTQEQNWMREVVKLNNLKVWDLGYYNVNPDLPEAVLKTLTEFAESRCIQMPILMNSRADFIQNAAVLKIYNNRSFKEESEDKSEMNYADHALLYDCKNTEINGIPFLYKFKTLYIRGGKIENCKYDICHFYRFHMRNSKVWKTDREVSMINCILTNTSEWLNLPTDFNLIFKGCKTDSGAPIPDGVFNPFEYISVADYINANSKTEPPSAAR